MKKGNAVQDVQMVSLVIQCMIMHLCNVLYDAQPLHFLLFFCTGSNVNPEPGTDIKTIHLQTTFQNFVVTCVQNGITYQDGDVWNPYFPKFGILKCQTCTCKVHTYILKCLQLDAQNLISIEW